LFDDEESEDASRACPFCDGGRCDHLLLEVDDYDCTLKGGHVELFEHSVRGKPVDVFKLINQHWSSVVGALGSDPDTDDKREAFEELLEPIRNAADAFVQFDIDAVPGMSWTPVRFYVSETRRAAVIKDLYRRFRPRAARTKHRTKNSRSRRLPKKPPTQKARTKRA
jgi:hypothetical protein